MQLLLKFTSVCGGFHITTRVGEFIYLLKCTGQLMISTDQRLVSHNCVSIEQDDNRLMVVAPQNKIELCKIRTKLLCCTASMVVK